MTITSTTCDLSCENGGYCALVPGDDKELSKRAAAGRLLERCICRPGYDGIACEQTVDECSVGVSGMKTCHSGVPCKPVASLASGVGAGNGSIDGGGDAQYGCDCGAAMAVSRFAYEMCRRPATEYCGRTSSVLANSFCTNGGSCAGNLGMIRMEDTGPFQHEGCVCPPEFHGPHCEYLVGYGPSSDSYGGRIQPASSSSLFILGRRGGTGSVLISIMILFGVAMAVVIVAVVTFQRRRRRGSRCQVERRKELERREMSLREDPGDVAEKQIATVAVPYSDAPLPSCRSGDGTSSSSGFWYY